MGFPRIYTLGHSNHTVDKFIQLLLGANIATLVDVRSRPVSRHNPQFKQDRLRQLLQQHGMVYHWAGRQLGGLRQQQADSQHIALVSDGLRAYADYMQGQEFWRAIGQLINLAVGTSTVIMCAEKDPMNCHRSLIADALSLRGCEVLHLLADGTQQRHHLRSELRRESASLIYDQNANLKLDI